MRMRNFVVLAAAALLAYSGAVVAQQDCASRPGLKLTVKKYHIDLNDKRPVCVELGGAFVIQIVNPQDGSHEVKGGEVTVQQKVAKDDAVMLISGDNNSPVNKVTVNVKLAEGKTKNDYAIGDEFEFWIKIEGVGTLDPRIRIIPGSSGS